MELREAERGGGTQLSVTQRELLATSSELLATLIELLASPSELLASPIERGRTEAAVQVLPRRMENDPPETVGRSTGAEVDDGGARLGSCSGAEAAAAAAAVAAVARLSTCAGNILMAPGSWATAATPEAAASMTLTGGGNDNGALGGGAIHGEATCSGATMATRQLRDRLHTRGTDPPP
jgi:hypothetical protein